MSTDFCSTNNYSNAVISDYFGLYAFSGIGLIVGFTISFSSGNSDPGQTLTFVPNVVAGIRVGALRLHGLPRFLIDFTLHFGPISPAMVRLIWLLTLRR